MANIFDLKRQKRNKKILELADKGWPHKSIAAMCKIKRVNTVSVIIWRARHKNDGGNGIDS